jgi:ferredoxin
MGKMAHSRYRPSWGLVWGNWTKDRYEPPLLHRLLKPKRITGNQINGVGETAWRQADVIYHAPQFKTPFRWVNFTLFMREILTGRSGLAVVGLFLKWSKTRPSPVAPAKPAMSPQDRTTRIKEVALANGADVVGIARMEPTFVFSNSNDVVTERWIVMMGARMDPDKVKSVADRQAVEEVMRAYDLGHDVSFAVAEWLRATGWPAKSHGNAAWSPINMVPAAIAAGLGELGNHGSIINRKLGSSFRLSYCLTDAPLVADAPDVFGAEDFCASCLVCNDACPPAAISHEKQFVRGELKYYVDFDACLPFFNDHGGCGICVAVCPWSRPAIAENLIQKMARRAARRQEPKSA